MTNLSIAFLIIITALGAFYALFVKELKIASGLLIITLAFVLAIPSLAAGFWSDALLALSLIVYLLGMLVLVYRKKKVDTVKSEEKIEENKNGK